MTRITLDHCHYYKDCNTRNNISHVINNCSLDGHWELETCLIYQVTYISEVWLWVSHREGQFDIGNTCFWKYTNIPNYGKSVSEYIHLKSFSPEADLFSKIIFLLIHWHKCSMCFSWFLLLSWMFHPKWCILTLEFLKTMEVTSRISQIFKIIRNFIDYEVHSTSILLFGFAKSL